MSFTVRFYDIDYTKHRQREYPRKLQPSYFIIDIIS